MLTTSYTTDVGGESVTAVELEGLVSYVIFQASTYDPLVLRTTKSPDPAPVRDVLGSGCRFVFSMIRAYGMNYHTCSRQWEATATPLSGFDVP